MRGLKILVAVMGVMLVLGTAGLVVAIAMRLSHSAPAPAAAPVPVATPATSFSAPPILLPHGSKIETMTVGSDRIVLQVDLADGSVELFVVDLASGRLLGRIPLKEQP